MSDYRPNQPISDKLKVVHATADATPSKAKGVKPMGQNVGGANPSILSNPQRGTSRA